MNINIAIITYFFLVQLPALALPKPFNLISQGVDDTPACQIQAENEESGEYSEKQLQTLASRITVRVIGDNNGGSGTLLAKKDNTYLVITNSHVVRGVNQGKRI